MCFLTPLSSKQTPHNTQYNHKNIQQSQHLGCILHNDITSWLDNSCVQRKQIKSRDQVPVDKTYQCKDHRDTQQNILSHEIVTRLHSIIVVIPEHVHKSKITTVYPSSTLDHELFMGFHGISVCDCIWDILESVFFILLAVYTQG